MELAPKYGASYESAMRRYTEKHTLPCALIVFDKVQEVSEESEFEDSKYKIHYTITSPSFRKTFFSGLEIEGGTIKEGELCEKDRWRGIEDIVEKELIVGRSDKQSWRFESEIFTNGYKVFQFVLPPKQATRS